MTLGKVGMIGKIGTVCMTGEVVNGKFVAAKGTKMGTVTRATMLKICGIDKQPELLTPDLVQQYFKPLQAKLLPKVKQNLQALREQIKYVTSMGEGEVAPHLNLFRISSDLLPLFDHEVLGVLYDDKVKGMIELSLAATRTIIDTHNVRICVHPDQFNVINSDKPKVREQTFRNLYMHKYFMGMLTDDININIHPSGALDHIPEFDSSTNLDLIPCLNFENEDKLGKQFQATTENTLLLCEKYGIKMLFDIHHHYVLTGTHLETSSETFSRIINTWQGKRPLLHLSQGREHSRDRKHSDTITNEELIGVAKKFLQYGDIELEAKHKSDAVRNLASKVF